MIKNVIVLTKEGKKEAWGSLTQACKEHPEFQYPTIKSKKYPFEHKGFKFEKLKYNHKIIK
jgi:hypothetical protein